MVAAELPRVLGHDLASQPDQDAVGVGMDLDRLPNRLVRHAVAVAVEANQAGCT
jgi:hypothetical protein